MRAERHKAGWIVALGSAVFGVVLVASGVHQARQSVALGEVEILARELKRETRTVSLGDIDQARREWEPFRHGWGVAEVALAIETAAGNDRMSRDQVREKAQRVAATARDVIKTSPLSSAGWCGLAESLMLSGEPAASLSRVLDGCYAVGARNVAALAVRARVSLLVWEALSENERQRALADIASGLLDPSVTSWVIEELGRFAAAAPSEVGARVGALVSLHAAAARWRYDEVVREQRRRLGRT